MMLKISGAEIESMTFQKLSDRTNTISFFNILLLISLNLNYETRLSLFAITLKLLKNKGRGKMWITL